MKDAKEMKTNCFNEGCRKTAEEGSAFCASCGLEWILFHRDVRVPREGYSPLPPKAALDGETAASALARS